ncbi:hypothetical protein B0H17DRAFT_1146242 [Mycena rosella]|uniref:Uncharacterized protein n=1 Tax=Mycena rosella TaxID=1033263 RepID=A0AAD7CRS8_MYCRO|nr:hypothetical protein B0H17DRAFT_1146242 [Mycena rosella]
MFHLAVMPLDVTGIRKPPLIRLSTVPRNADTHLDNAPSGTSIKQLKKTLRISTSIWGKGHLEYAPPLEKACTWDKHHTLWSYIYTSIFFKIPGTNLGSRSQIHSVLFYDLTAITGPDKSSLAARSACPIFHGPSEPWDFTCNADTPGKCPGTTIKHLEKTLRTSTSI